MRVLFSSLRNTSHFLPLVPFIRACLAQGHEVAVAAPIDLAERVAKTGASFFPVGHPGDEGLRPYWARMREVPPEESGRVVVAEIFAGVCATSALPALLETVDTWKPDVIVRESTEFASLLAASKFGVRHARVGILTRSAEQPLMAAASPALDVHRGSLGLPLDPAGDLISHEPVLTLFPASFDAQPVPAPVLRFREPRKPPAPLANYWGTRQAPFVYLTLGTVAGSMADVHGAYRVALEALGALPIRVLLTTGADLPPETLGEIPENVHVEKFVPQDDVLPHAAVVVCHGGSGTVIGALAAGAPMVVAPQFADQPSNAAQVQALGAGVALPTRTATALEMREAVARVLAEASFREVAGRIAAEIGALPPVADAAAALARL